MNVLRSLGTAIREALLHVPLPLVRLVFVGLIVAVLVWVLRLPREETCPGNGAENCRWWQNLKVWAAAALLIQLLVYSLV